MNAAMQSDIGKVARVIDRMEMAYLVALNNCEIELACTLDKKVKIWREKLHEYGVELTKGDVQLIKKMDRIGHHIEVIAAKFSVDVEQIETVLREY